LPIDAPSMGRLLAQAKSNVEAPWIGLSVFVTLAVMLTLLIFIGEAVRDSFDPRRTIGAAEEPPEPVIATLPAGGRAQVGA
jgi:microcin C transport system permease protein